MPPIYGNDFGQLGQAVAADALQRRVALLDSFHTVMTAQQQARDNALRQRELSLRQAYQDFQQQAEQQKFGENVRQFDIGTGLANRQLDIQEGAKAGANSPAAIRLQKEQDDQYKLAAGTFKSPDDLTARIPGLPPDRALQFWSIEESLQKPVLDQHTRELAMAKQANLVPVLAKQADIQTQAQDQSPWNRMRPRGIWDTITAASPMFGLPRALGALMGGGPNQPSDADVAALTARQTALKAALPPKPEMDKILLVDPRNGRRIPMTQPPPATDYFLSRATNAPAANRTINLPSSAVNVQPMGAPPATGTNGAVQVQMPDGRVWTIPATNAAGAVQRGGRVIGY